MRQGDGDDAMREWAPQRRLFNNMAELCAPMANLPLAPRTVPRNHDVMRIEIVAFDGMDELDAVVPFEVLTNAAANGADWDVALVGVSDPGQIIAAHGMRVDLTEVLGTPDAVIVPGGGYGDRAAKGTWQLINDGYLPAKIREIAPGCEWVASVCTGALLLAAAGITAGRPATTHHIAHEALAATGAQLIDARIVDDGNLITCGGITAGLDLSLWLIERELGPDLATRVARDMEYERGGKLWRAGVLV
jgi:transcriptional regulator GlxA family with amidase domain